MQQTTHRNLIAVLQPKQQTLDFATTNLWAQLPVRDQDACRVVISQLLAYVIQSEVEDQNDE